MKLKKGEFNFLHYDIKNIEIKVNKKTEHNLVYSVDAGISDIVYGEKYANFGLKMQIEGTYQEDVYRKVTIEIVGVFDGFKEIGKEQFQKYCHVIGVPNLLQTARSTISAVTSLMNMQPPINLPLFNLKKSIVENKKENERA